MTEDRPESPDPKTRLKPAPFAQLKYNIISSKVMSRIILLSELSKHHLNADLRIDEPPLALHVSIRDLLKDHFQFLS